MEDSNHDKTAILRKVLPAFELLVRQRRIVVITVLFITIPVFIRLLFMGPLYTAEITILPPDNTNKLPLSALEGATSKLLGLSFSSRGDITIMYSEILKSRNIGMKLLKTKFYSNLYSKPRKLLEFIDVDAESEAERMDKKIKIFKDLMEIQVNELSKLPSPIILPIK